MVQTSFAVSKDKHIELEMALECPVQEKLIITRCNFKGIHNHYHGSKEYQQ